MFNPQLDKNSKEHLRHNSMVEEWIKTYQSQNTFRTALVDCHRCGWPHHGGIMCGMGATFGAVQLGGDYCYVDTSNVAWMVDFILSLGKNSFHWKNQIYVARQGDKVVISHIEFFNGNPNVEDWKIPVNEFASIVCAASIDGENSKRFTEALNFLGDAAIAKSKP